MGLANGCPLGRETVPPSVLQLTFLQPIVIFTTERMRFFAFY